MKDIQPTDITAILIQMILAVVDDRLSEIKENIKKQILMENKPFLTVEDVSNITLLKKSTIYRYCSEGKIGYYRPTGKHTFFTWDSIREFILNQQFFSEAKSEIRRKVQSQFINETKF